MVGPIVTFSLDQQTHPEINHMCNYEPLQHFSCYNWQINIPIIATSLLVGNFKGSGQGRGFISERAFGFHLEEKRDAQEPNEEKNDIHCHQICSQLREREEGSGSEAPTEENQGGGGWIGGLEIVSFLAGMNAYW